MKKQEGTSKRQPYPQEMLPNAREKFLRYPLYACGGNRKMMNCSWSSKDTVLEDRFRPANLVDDFRCSPQYIHSNGTLVS